MRNSQPNTCPFVKVVERLPQCPCDCIPPIPSGPLCPFKPGSREPLANALQNLLQQPNTQESGCPLTEKSSQGQSADSSQLCVFSQPGPIDFKLLQRYSCSCVPGTCPELAKNVIRSLGFDPMCACPCPQTVTAPEPEPIEPKKKQKRKKKDRSKSTPDASKTDVSIKSSNDDPQSAVSASMHGAAENQPTLAPTAQPAVASEAAGVGTVTIATGDTRTRGPKNSAYSGSSTGSLLLEGKGFKIFEIDGEKVLFNYSTKNCPLLKCKCSRKDESSCGCSEWGGEIKKMRADEVHVRKSEFFSPHVDPYYANTKYDLYYPKACPEGSEEVVSKKCLMTPSVLSGLLNLDLARIAQNVEVDKSRTLRYIKALDEKLNSPQYEFLKEFQPDISCACDETNLPDAQCPCPPVKQPMKFDLLDKSCYLEPGGSANQCFPNEGYTSCPAGVRTDPQVERDELMRQNEALQNKFSSPDYGFLYLQPVELVRCACSPDNFPHAECVCAPSVKPIDFRDKHEVKKKIQAMDGLLKSPVYGLSDSCKSDGRVKTEQRTGGQRCIPGGPPPHCRCGIGCPSMRGRYEKYPERTFHVPDCPGDNFIMPLPKSPVQGDKACPFSPACCPIGDVCPFPVNTVYDPSVPPLPALKGPRRCPRVPTDPLSISDPSRPPCPLNPLKPPAATPQGCPLVKPSACPIGQESNCPLLTCSLGPLKTLIFDGNDECPFCQSKCCPMITPDGPGCPIKVSGNFCPLGNTDVCALKGMSSPPQIPTSSQPGKDEESCPVGELLAQRAQAPTGSSQPPTTSCYCAAAFSTNDKSKRPEDCPLAAMDVRPPAPPCPLTTPPSKKQCPMTKVGGTNFDESCPVSNMFQCPGLKKGALAKLLSHSSTKLHTKGSDRLKKVPSKEKSLGSTNVSSVKLGQSTAIKGRNSYSKRSTGGRNSTQRRVSSNPALQQNPSSVAAKTENIMRKAASTVYDSMATNTTRITRTKSKSSESSLFEVSLEPLPRPPLSEYENTRNSFRSRRRSRRSSSLRRSSKSRSPEKEDASHLRTALPDDSKGFQRASGKPKPKNCPFPEPEKCPLEVPKCPFGPPEPSCPLAKTTNCGARACCKTGMALNASRNDCPVETPGCNIFPEGHCPMEDMNMCECNFPVSPCMEPLIPEEDAGAPDQYCSRMKCCMGLPLPPTKPSEEFETDTWYAFAEVLPGDKATKRYLEIINYPPEPEFFVSVNKERKHPAWKIIKQGEGYKQCKKVKELLAERGPSADATTQFQLNDLPVDEEIRIIEQNRINSQKAIQNLRGYGLRPSGWTDIC